MKNSNDANNKLVANNKKAYHDYFIEDTFEAGIMLEGAEVKSVRLGNISIKDSYALLKNGELWLINAHISPYKMATMFPIESRRTRKLLLHKAEINKLCGKVDTKGYTLVPTKVYFKDALVKIEIGVAKGKELHDKRASLAEKENKRKLDRIMKNYNVR